MFFGAERTRSKPATGLSFFCSPLAGVRVDALDVQEWAHGGFNSMWSRIFESRSGTTYPAGLSTLAIDRPHVERFPTSSSSGWRRCSRR